ncbi:ATP synthase F1 subunit gamma [Candidatus Nomurabacteria bacterium]|nr:ATP synthase F1 subunit gamma [Candidatus Kaiserbacteria bacterium]MCB9814130.1 ATP synthase F1 subunit gamma [Candidatus Nomurabacteria bacterium]
MSSTKDLKQRIKGTKNTSKITAAMEMISAVKMRKAVAKVIAIRPYAESALQVLEKVSQAVKLENIAIFKTRTVKNVLIVVVTSNRGLCGSFNTQIIKEVRSQIEKLEAKNAELNNIEFLSIGKKGDKMLRRFGKKIVASYPDIVSEPSMEAISSVSRLLRDEFDAEKYDKVVLVYTDYISPMVQKTRSRRILPLSYGAVEDELDEMDKHPQPSYINEEIKTEKLEKVKKLESEYTIEPSPEQVLRTLVPRLLRMQLYHALLESNASQEAARMLAMRNATEAAKDMIGEFTLAYNQLRQAKVTQEIAELSAGMAAVEG